MKDAEAKAREIGEALSTYDELMEYHGTEDCGHCAIVQMIESALLKARADAIEEIAQIAEHMAIGPEEIRSLSTTPAEGETK